MPLADPMRLAPALPPPRPGPLRRRHALLVLPFYAKDAHASYGKHVLTPAQTFPVLAAATPAEWSVEMWDENLLQGPPPLDRLPEVVGITVHLTFAKRAYELAAWFRAHGCTVVLGGLHALSCPDEVAAHADALAIGEGSVTWPAILRDVAAGRLQRRYQAEFDGFAATPLPDRSVLPSWAYLTPMSMIATAGCHNRCDFCYLATGERRIPYQKRRASEVAQDFARTDSPYAVFIDNNLGSHRAYLRELCASLRPLRKIWSAAVSIDVTDDPLLVREMARAGCTGVFVGFESLTDANLAAAGKRSPRADDYARRVRLFHDQGIQVNGSFVLGFDHDRPDCFERLGDWIEASRLECATFHILTPYPNTPLFARMKQADRILHENWELYDTAHCVFRPRHLSPEQLEAGYAQLYRRIFTLRSIWARRPVPQAEIASYLAMALLYKKSNWLWPLLIRHRLTHAAWRPLVELARRKHLRGRDRLDAVATPRRATGRARLFQPGV